MVTLYRDMIIVRAAIPSVSKNLEGMIKQGGRKGRSGRTHLRPRHARGPALNGKKASLGQSGVINRSGLNISGSGQYFAV